MDEMQGCTSKETEISKEMALLSGLSSNVSDVIGNLLCRLEPVMVQAKPQPKDATKTTQETKCKHGQELSEISGRLNGVIYRVNDALQRLEL